MKNKRKNEERRSNTAPPAINIKWRGVANERAIAFVDRRTPQRHTDDEVQILLVTASTLMLISMTETDFDKSELVDTANALVKMAGFDPDSFIQSKSFRKIQARYWGIPT